VKEKRQSKTNLQDIDTCRYISNGELIILLSRAFHFGTKWLRYVHIIMPTNTSFPEKELQELFKENYKLVRKRIYIHYDNEILPSSAIPSFSSHPVEANLDKIKGLSEQFVYACDDMWLNQSFELSSFFDDNGHPVYRKHRSQFPCIDTKWPICPVRKSIYHDALHNSANMLNLTSFYQPDHQMEPLTKTGFQIARTRFPQEFYTLTHSKFRSFEDFHPISLVMNILLSIKLASISKTKQIKTKHIALYDNMWYTKLHRNIAICNGLYKCELLCINDAGTTSNKYREWMYKLWLISNTNK
jgi:hypothetical protein